MIEAHGQAPGDSRAKGAGGDGFARMLDAAPEAATVQRVASRAGRLACEA